MNLRFSSSDQAFREEVRDWLEGNIPRQARPLDGRESVAFDLEWQRTQYDGGWAGIAWPREYGGRGASLIQQLIWHEEYTAAGGPSLGNMFVALSHAGPTLILRGDDAQKAFHLPRILKGESMWCQGFSEPGAGSDLASLRTRGVVDGDSLVVTGQKIWTSYAQHAQYQELLVRTNTDAPKHKGLTWVICDMSLPGITVRPILSMAGEYHFNEVFYDEVRIPLGNVVGRIDDGWSVAMCTLSLERGVSYIPRQMGLAQQMARLIELARTTGAATGVGAAIDDDEVAHRLAILQTEVAALRSMTYLAISRGLHNDLPGPEGSMIALYFCELQQRVTQAAMDILGPQAIELPSHHSWTWEHLNAFRTTISGGTSEIRRNVIAERVLGLPR